MMIKVDLNSDLGESFGIYKIGNDSEVLKYVSSANIACGLHAGDPFVMHKTVKLALENNTAIGAHPGYMDLNGFGRRKMDYVVLSGFHALTEHNDGVRLQEGALPIIENWKKQGDIVEKY